MVHKAFARTQKAMSLLLVLLMTSLLAFIPVASATAANQEMPSTKTSDYKTSVSQGTHTDYFTYAGGNLLFGGANSLPEPGNGSYPSDVSFDISHANNKEMLLKLLYYGYGGPGNGTYPSGTKPDTSEKCDAYIIAEQNVHRAVHGEYSPSFYSELNDQAEDEWNRVLALPTPDWDLAFSPESTSSTIVTLSDGTKIQRSATITLTGGSSDNTVKIPVPSPYTIRMSDGTAYAAGTTATIKVGEIFAVEAPVGYTGTFNPSGLKGEKATRMVPIVLTYTGDVQVLYGGVCYGTNVELSVSFGGLTDIIPSDSNFEIEPFGIPPKEYSIVVHKYGVDSTYTSTLDPVGTLNEGGVVGYVVDEDGNTVEITLDDLRPLANVPFLLERLLLNPSTEPDVDTYIVDTSFEPVLKKTDSMGIITYDRLDPGIYRVTEQPNNISLQTASPAIFTLPFAGPDGTILNTVHIYPKNVITSPEIEKTLGDGEMHGTANIPDEIPWTIRTSIPRDIDECETYVINDPLAPILSLVDGSLKLSFPDASDNTVPLIEGADYTYTADIVDGVQTLSITLTTSGKTKLATTFSTADRSDERWLTTEFSTKVNVAPEELEEYLATAVENQAELVVKDSAGVNYSPKSEIPEVHLGGVLLKKVNRDNEVLSGAQFKVYPTLTDARAGTNAIKDPANIAQDWVITSDANGLVKIFGLSYGTAGQLHNDVAASSEYWIVEVASPKDEVTGNYYSLLIEPFKVTVNAVSHLSENSIMVINVMPELPATGGIGTMWFASLGILAVIAGATIGILAFIIGVAIVTLRKKFAK